MVIRDLIGDSQQRLAEALQLAATDARFEAQLLLQTLLAVNRAWLIAHEHEVLPAAAEMQFKSLLQRRLAGEPVAYILGKREFYGLDLRVTPDTLIPRPDTETLVEAALPKIPVDQPSTILDLGTGTGAIACALAIQRPQARLTATDKSAGALAVASGNAQQLKISNVRFLQSDWFSALRGSTYDVIVSNPPYIAEGDSHLTQGDLRFEPRTALASGPDGLDAIRQIIRHAPAHLQTTGWLLLEHGFDQAGKVAELMQQAGFDNIAHAQDLAGIARVTLGRFSRSPPDTHP